MEFIKTTRNNIDINIIKTTKFKTTRIQVVFVGKLDEKTLTARALMPYLLKSISKKYPKRDIMSAHLEELYASSFNVGVSKITDGHVITFDSHFIDNAYTFNNQDLLNDVLDFIKEVLYNPLLTEAIFIEEKRLMEEYFTGIYSNKVKYAFHKLKDIMFENDTFRLSPLGDQESLSLVTLADVKNAYSSMISNDRVFISVIGNVDEETIYNKIAATFDMNSNVSLPKLISNDKPVVKETTFHEEQIAVKQSTLISGYQFNVLYKEKDYYPALIFNLLLGGSAESLLFKEIREKSSLVYSINSSYDPYKGVLFIFGGINANDYTAVMTKTKQLIESLIHNGVSEDALEITKKLFLNGVIQGMDSNHSLLGKMNQSYIFDYDYNLEETLNKINRVTMEEVRNVAKKLFLDTVYMVRGEDHE